jgi:hypothetical protein
MPSFHMSCIAWINVFVVSLGPKSKDQSATGVCLVFKKKVLQEPSNKEDHNPISHRCGRKSDTLLQCAANVLQAPVGASRSIMIKASLTLTLQFTILPLPFQNADRFKIFRYIVFVIYLDIIYIQMYSKIYKSKKIKITYILLKQTTF